MESQKVSPIPDAERWSYGPFQAHHETRSITVPLVRDDGTSAEFTVPEFVADSHDIRQIAVVVIRALEKWEDVEGLGA